MILLHGSDGCAAEVATEFGDHPEIAVRPFIYKEGQVVLRPLGSPSPTTAQPGDARVDYDVAHARPWGVDMALYLLGRLWSPEQARTVQKGVQYFPDPPYQDVPIPPSA